jgi:ribonuclease BN (tRNA processing enzyme)
VRLAFLGSGAAFSTERYNGAVVVDDRLLLDAGAPLLPHMARLGIDPGGIQALFLTHFHGDHILGLPPFLLHLAFAGGRGGFVIVGQEGVQEHLEQLFRLCWHGEWPGFRERAGLEYDEGRAEGEAAGVRYETVRLRHGKTPARGYRLQIGGRTLAYAGDTQATPELEQLVDGADVVITEATATEQSSVHTSWAEAQALAARHPRTRFFFNHLYRGELPGAVRDLELVDL